MINGTRLACVFSTICPARIQRTRVVVVVRTQDARWRNHGRETDKKAVRDWLPRSRQSCEIKRSGCETDCGSSCRSCEEAHSATKSGPSHRCMAISTCFPLFRFPRYSGTCRTRSRSCSGRQPKFLAISGAWTVSCSASPIIASTSWRPSGRFCSAQSFSHPSL